MEDRWHPGNRIIERGFIWERLFINMWDRRTAGLVQHLRAWWQFRCYPRRGWKGWGPGNSGSWGHLHLQSTLVWGRGSGVGQGDRFEIYLALAEEWNFGHGSRLHFPFSLIFRWGFPLSEPTEVRVTYAHTGPGEDTGRRGRRHIICVYGSIALSGMLCKKHLTGRCSVHLYFFANVKMLQNSKVLSLVQGLFPVLLIKLWNIETG